MGTIGCYRENTRRQASGQIQKVKISLNFKINDITISKNYTSWTVSRMLITSSMEATLFLILPSLSPQIYWVHLRSPVLSRNNKHFQEHTLRATSFLVLLEYVLKKQNKTVCSSKALLSKVRCACVHCMCPHVGISVCVCVCIWIYWAQEGTLLQFEEMIEPVFLMADYDGMKYTSLNFKCSFLPTGVISGVWGWA